MGIGRIHLVPMVEMSLNSREVLEESQWLEMKERHQAYVLPLIDAYRDRRSRQMTHPVHDFLFTYYQTNRQTLKRWRPAANVSLKGEAAKEFLEDERYCSDEVGVRLNLEELDEGTLKRAQWVKVLINAAKSRSPRFNCFGLHEWAMVYRADEIRHEKTPLRLSKEALAKVVEASQVRCTHFDAFRFFTPEAKSLNEMQPGRDERERNEQFGCVHFNMDLYRWSYKLSPWIGSNLIRDCFELALKARELDMRASPYDLSGYGYDAIYIETSEGRDQYRQEQQVIYEAAQPLAERLLAECEYILGTIEA